MLLSDGAFNPVSMLYDQYEVFAHTGQKVLIDLNVALGTMHWVPGQEGHKAQIADGFAGHFVITKHAIFIILGTLLVVGMFMWANFVSGTTKKGAPRGVANLLEAVLRFIRDEIVYPNVKDPHHDHGHDAHGHGGGAHAAAKPTHVYADRLMPLFCTLFFFIGSMNLLGLIPGASTPTNAITITGSLAAVVLLVYVIGGMMLQKPFIFGFFKNLVPKCPIALWPLMFLLEFAGMFAKPFSLTVRLFANMTAGHCILLSFAFLATLAVQGLGGMGLALGAISSLTAVAIYCLELFVALLQAYIFTYLAAIFIGGYLVPEH